MVRKKRRKSKGNWEAKEMRRKERHQKNVVCEDTKMEEMGTVK